mgnify:FL=1
MRVSLTKLPKYPWWGTGTPAYENNLAMKLGATPNQQLVEKQHQSVFQTLQKYAQVELFPFPQELDTNALNKHDFVFTRDGFISNQRGDIVISNFAERERQAEAELMANYLEKKGYRLHRLSANSYAEGGEFYYAPKDDLLFAGICRNNMEGIIETAKLLNIKNIQIVKSDSFHLDTVFTLLLDSKGYLAGIIVCLDLIKNKEEIEEFAKKKNIELINVRPIDTIDNDGEGRITVNCLSLPGFLLGGDEFKTPGVEQKIKDLGIKHIITSVSQFKMSGGGIHCLVNELVC